MKTYLKTTALSSYTFAKNCTDLDDVNVGINELKEWKELREYNNLEIPDLYYVRLAKLVQKSKKYN